MKYRKEIRRFLSVVISIITIAVLIPVTAFASTDPNYLEFPYFDDFQAHSAFVAGNQVSSEIKAASPRMLAGSLPKPYELSTITQMNSADGAGTIELYNDGKNKMIKSTRKAQTLNFDTGDFKPGLLTDLFYFEFRFMTDVTTPADEAANPRVYGGLALNEEAVSGTEHTNFLKLFFLVGGNVRMSNTSDAASNSTLNDSTGTAYKMQPKTWYTLSGFYNFSSASNNYSLTLSGGGMTPITRVTTLRLPVVSSVDLDALFRSKADKLTRFRLSHFSNDKTENGTATSTIYYSDLSFYTNTKMIAGGMSMPITDDFENYDEIEAQAQLVNASGNLDYPPMMNRGSLPGYLGNSSLTPSQNAANSGYIYTSVEDIMEGGAKVGENQYLTLERRNNWKRTNLDIAPFAKGDLTENKISLKFRLKMGNNSGGTNQTGFMVLLAPGTPGDDADNFPSVPLFYVYPDRVMMMKNNPTSLSSFNPQDENDSIKLMLNDNKKKVMLIKDNWYNFETVFDYQENKISLNVGGTFLDINNQPVTQVCSLTVDNIPKCNVTNPRDLVSLRFRADRRGNDIMTASIDDLDLRMIPKFKFDTEIQDETNVSPSKTKSIRVDFPQEKADSGTFSNVSIYPEIENFVLRDVSENGFTVDLSNSPVLQENTAYEIRLNGVLSTGGNALYTNTVKFNTGSLDQYDIDKSSFMFSKNGSMLHSIQAGTVDFSLKAANFTSKAVEIATALYKKDANGYDTLLDYKETSIRNSGSYETVSQTVIVPQNEECYIKGYFFTDALTSAAQNFVFDKNGLYFTERADIAYKSVYYDTTNLTASANVNMASNVCDGSLSSYWTSGTGSDEYITIDLGREIDLDSVRLAFPKSTDNLGYRYTVSTSLDGTGFTKVSSGNTKDRENLKYIQNNFSRTTARFVRIQRDTAMAGPLKIGNIAINEISDNQYWALNNSY